MRCSLNQRSHQYGTVLLKVYGGPSETLVGSQLRQQLPCCAGAEPVRTEAIAHSSLLETGLN